MSSDCFILVNPNLNFDKYQNTDTIHITIPLLFEDGDLLFSWSLFCSSNTSTLLSNIILFLLIALLCPLAEISVSSLLSKYKSWRVMLPLSVFGTLDSVCCLDLEMFFHLIFAARIWLDFFNFSLLLIFKLKSINIEGYIDFSSCLILSFRSSIIFELWSESWISLLTLTQASFELDQLSRWSNLLRCLSPFLHFWMSLGQDFLCFADIPLFADLAERSLDVLCGTLLFFLLKAFAFISLLLFPDISSTKKNNLELHTVRIT